MLKSLLSKLNDRRAHVARRFAKCDSGSAIIEFAFVVPISLAIFFAVTEIAYYDLNNRRAQYSVEFAADYMSRDDDFIFSQGEIWMAEDIWQIVNNTSFKNTGGDAYNQSRGKYTRSFSAVHFEKDPLNCTIGEPDCELVPKMEWSFLASQGISDPKRRHCNQVIVPNGHALDETTLPIGVVGRSSLAIADFTWKYQPLFKNGLLPEGKEKHITAIRAMRGDRPLAAEIGGTSHWVRC